MEIRSRLSEEAKAAGETLFAHKTSETCPCKPFVGRIYKKNNSGYAQYNTTKILSHNIMPAKVTA